MTLDTYNIERDEEPQTTFEEVDDKIREHLSAEDYEIYTDAFMTYKYASRAYRNNLIVALAEIEKLKLTIKALRNE